MSLDLQSSHPEFQPAAEVRREADYKRREEREFRSEPRATAINASSRPDTGRTLQARPLSYTGTPSAKFYPNQQGHHPSLQRRRTFPDNRRRNQHPSDRSQHEDQESLEPREFSQPLTIIRQIYAEVFATLRHAAKYIRNSQDPRLQGAIKEAVSNFARSQDQAQDLQAERIAWEEEFPLLAPTIAEFEEGIDYVIYQTSGYVKILPEGREKLKPVEKLMGGDPQFKIDDALDKFFAIKSKESPESFEAKAARLLPRLQNGVHYKVDRSSRVRRAILTDQGFQYFEDALGIDDFNNETLLSIENALDSYLGFEDETLSEEPLERNWSAIIAQAVTFLSPTDDYTVKGGAVEITPRGMNRIEALIGSHPLYDEDLSIRFAQADAALALHISKGDKETRSEREAAKFVTVIARLKLDGSECVVDRKKQKVKLTDGGKARTMKLLQSYRKLDDKTVEAIEGKLAENLFGSIQIQPVVQLTEAEQEKIEVKEAAEERLAKLINGAVRKALEKGKADRRTRAKLRYDFTATEPVIVETAKATEVPIIAETSPSQQASTEAAELARLKEKYQEELKSPKNGVDHEAEYIAFAAINPEPPETPQAPETPEPPSEEDLVAERKTRRIEALRTQSRLRMTEAIDHGEEH